MSIRCKSVCVDGAFTLVENLQSHEENEVSLPLGLSSTSHCLFFLSHKHYIGLNHFFLKILDFRIIEKDTVETLLLLF